VTEKKEEYLSVTVHNYFDQPATLELVNKFRFESWVEEDKKRRAYYESPEGKAELARKREEREARYKREAKFAKRWQWLHDKLASKGCECNHDGCNY